MLRQKSHNPPKMVHSPKVKIETPYYAFYGFLGRFKIFYNFYPPKTNVKYCLTPPPRSCVQKRIPPHEFLPQVHIIFEHSLSFVYISKCLKMNYQIFLFFK